MLKGYMRLTNRVVGMVNSSQGVSGRLREGVAPKKVRDSLLKCVRWCAEYRFSAGISSEVSIRARSTHYLITPRDAWFGALKDADLVIGSIDGSRLPGEAQLPEHHAVHQALYQSTDANAVVLCQPAALMVYSANHPDGELKVSDVFAGGEQAAQGMQVGHSLEAALNNGAHGWIARNQFILLWGNDPASVMARLDALNRAAEISLLAK